MPDTGIVMAADEAGMAGILSERKEGRVNLSTCGKNRLVFSHLEQVRRLLQRSVINLETAYYKFRQSEPPNGRLWRSNAKL